jgi:hypothetical protein
MPRTSFAVAIAMLLLAGASRYAGAAPLDPEGCAKLKASIEDFEKAGVRDNMAKGPAWAKANLPADKLEDIRRLIDADEQHLFRCPGRHLVNLPLEPDPPPPPPSENKTDGEPKAPPPAPKPEVAKAASPEKKANDKAKAQPPQQKKAQPPQKAPTPAATEGDSQKQPPKAKSAQKPKAKPKDDAYKPPPGDNDNPLGLN